MHWVTVTEFLIHLKLDTYTYVNIEELSVRDEEVFLSLQGLNWQSRSPRR